MDLQNNHKKLFIPGPTEVRAEILEEMSRPMIGHRAEEFGGLKKGILINVVNKTKSPDLVENAEDGVKKSPKLRAGRTNHIVDIDGVVCEDIPNEEPERMKTASEIPGAKEKINKWHEQGNIITFFTSRTEDLREITEKWLKEHGFKYHKILFNKPRGGNYHYIDDKNIKSTKFNGKFEEL